MPIPNPKSSENKTDFITRCVSQISSEYPQDQSIAICISSWENTKFKEYSWGKCVGMQMERGYNVGTAEKICKYLKKKYQE